MRAVIWGGRKNARGIPYWPARAKDLRYRPDIYARYGGDDGDCQARPCPGRDAARGAALQNRDPCVLRKKGWVPGLQCIISLRSCCTAPGTRYPRLRAPAARYARVMQNRSPKKKKRAQGKPGAQCTRSLACESKKHTSVVTTGSPELPGLPCALVLTAYNVLPGDRALLPPSPALLIADLTPASGRQDHTPWPSARWCRSSCDATRVHRIPPHVRDDAYAPLVESGWRES
jgi:hypothetical protein